MICCLGAYLLREQDNEPVEESKDADDKTRKSSDYRQWARKLSSRLRCYSVANVGDMFYMRYCLNMFPTRNGSVKKKSCFTRSWWKFLQFSPNYFEFSVLYEFISVT